MIKNINAFNDNQVSNSLIITDYDNIKHRHYVNIKSKTINGLKLTVDTGADTTIISRKTLSDSLNLSKDELNVKLKIFKMQILGFANGESVETKIYPCCILNAKIDRLTIPRLYFTILEIDSNDLLGNDFLDFCKIEKDINCSYRIVDFNYDDYKSDFVKKYDFSVNSYIDNCELNYFGGE